MHRIVAELLEFKYPISLHCFRSKVNMEYATEGTIDLVASSNDCISVLLGVVYMCF